MGRATPNPLRKTEFNWLIANEIVDRISEGEFMTDILKDAHMPSSWTINQWMHEYPQFASDVAQAREMGAMHWLEQATKVAVTPTTADKVVYGVDGVTLTREDPVAARKLAAWGLQEAAKRICPQKYGDKVAVTGGPKDDAPATLHVQHEHTHVVRKVERAFLQRSLPAESDPAA
jgi:hypothetical protein